MSTLFRKLDGQVIVRRNGVRYQRHAYEWRGQLHVAHGGGFIRLKIGGCTSVPSVLWEYIEEVPELAYKEGQFGRLVLT